MKSVRNPSIEKFRAFLMFGICWLHASTMCVPSSPLMGRISYLLSTCVVGFLFITGWFGTSFSWRKVARLYGVVIYATGMVVGLKWAAAGHFDFDLMMWMLTKNWFVNGYIFMMVMSPFVNKCVSRLKNDSYDRCAWIVLSILWILVFGWSWLSYAPIVGTYLPRIPYLEPYSGITLLGIYAAARIVRVLNLEEKCWKYRWVLLAVSGLVVLAHFGSYASPFAFIFAMVVFGFSKRGMSADWWLRLSPSMFTVFVLHSNPYGFELMMRFEQCVLGMCANEMLAFILAAICCYLICLAIDMLRRLVLCSI